MTYLNIILTLLFVVFALNLWVSLVVGGREMKEHDKMKQYNREVNDLSLKLHEEILQELKRR